MALLRSTLLLLSTITSALATDLCPIYGPVFPPVADLSTSSTFRTAASQIKAVLDNAFATGKTSHGSISADDTYSIQIFSKEKTLFEYYHKGKIFVGSKHDHEVNGDSVYRTGGVGGLYTVYLLLAIAGDKVFCDPVTKYLPELKGVAYWDEVTVGDIAGNIGGMASDVYETIALPGGDLSARFPGAFPTLSSGETSPCIYNATQCTRAEFLHALKKRRFTYQPNTTPAYSNSAFVLLGYIVESLAHKPFTSALQTRLLKPLHLDHTFVAKPPNDKNNIIIKDETASGWNIAIPPSGGGLYASASDVSTLGRSILSSALLSPRTTRAWLKPTAFTSSTVGFVGRGWEIYRLAVPLQANRVVDIYTKRGDINAYSAIVALIPDWDIGFTILIGAEKRTTGAVITVEGVITDILIPAVEEAARWEVDKAYTGTYRAKHLNSSITVRSEKGKPGLRLESWVSNGTDMFAVFQARKDFRLYPSNVGDDGSGEYGRKRVSWKAVGDIDLGYTGGGLFSACPTWIQIDRPSWGRYGLDDFVFELEKGTVKHVELAALKIVLERVR